MSSFHAVSAAFFPQGEDSHSSPAPVWRQSSMNFSNLRPSPGLYSSQTAPGWDPSLGCSPPGKGCSNRGLPFCQEPALAWASLGLTASCGHTPALEWSPPGTAGKYLLPCRTAGSHGKDCLTMGCTLGCRCLQNLLLHFSWCLQSSSFH